MTKMMRCHSSDQVAKDCDFCFSSIFSLPSGCGEATGHAGKTNECEPLASEELSLSVQQQSS